jgi:phage terminase small subunit
MALNNKQQAFVNEYLQCFNATEAALRAGYSERTAHSIGWENLRKPEILGSIQMRLSESAMSADEVLMRLAEHARGDINDMLSDSGELDIEKARLLKKTHLIKKVTNRRMERSSDKGEYVETVTVVELYDAQSALTLLGKHHGLFTERQEISGPNGGPVETKTKHDLSKLNVDELLQLRSMLQKTDATTND